MSQPCPHCPPGRRESRAHCIDIETAYVQGCEKLDQAVLVGERGVGSGVGPRQGHNLPCAPQAVKELQTSTREAIVLLKAMIEEVRNSASEEESAINALFSGMQVWGCARGCPSSPMPCSGVLAWS